MKAQFALIEAAISMVLIASAVGFVSSQMNVVTANFNEQEGALQRSAALYDMVNVLRQNMTANNCLSAIYMTNQSGCMQNLTEFYAKLLGLSSMELTKALSQQQSTENASEACFAVFLSEVNLTSSVCMIARN
jgi:hypothetical protein